MNPIKISKTWVFVLILLLCGFVQTFATKRDSTLKYKNAIVLHPLRQLTGTYFLEFQYPLRNKTLFTSIGVQHSNSKLFEVYWDKEIYGACHSAVLSSPEDYFNSIILDFGLIKNIGKSKYVDFFIKPLVGYKFRFYDSQWLRDYYCEDLVNERMHVFLTKILTGIEINISNRFAVMSYTGLGYRYKRRKVIEIAFWDIGGFVSINDIPKVEIYHYHWPTAHFGINLMYRFNKE
ncbi:MAG: hypothetical protein COC01_09885 [Bacteroidetes bacterium]|nr:hypothetical protein [Bacteroidia bacterium]MBL4715511.1 hypothetical protein [Bacteroidia bacterium]MBN4052120.1 hypothetical protein [Sphingobacteriaceae bacterium AH-315-L07]PCH65313.1 MAG: hypothetical protein COC01_09885 [Bacteroidota bacterium]